MEPTNEVLPVAPSAPIEAAGAGTVHGEVVAAPSGEAAPAAEPSAELAAQPAGETAPAEAAVGGQHEAASSDGGILTHNGERHYPSLYDGVGTTVAAIVFGVVIVGAIQGLVVKMYSNAKSEHDYLTRFVTSLVAMIVGCYVADLLIAGPSTQLLSPNEKTLILTFVKDTALMIFSYYFGLKAQTPSDTHKTEE
jgi:hypothetical protein